ncbi:uncharacterized protein VP01_7506g1 [Puccinia sorghi]|uniref:Uncharacterized protein n=1 Tax=Puccinia sorghi TaxID=27349 RepID=A0A0L6UC76_9BASI|nr:uncharacterized protein VP01_7506g1 [Puccinia sorghi]
MLKRKRRRLLLTSTSPSHPPSTAISNWAKIVAASIELMADNLYMPPPPDNICGSDQLVQGVQILKNLDSLKNSSLNFDTTNSNPAPNQEVFQQPHSVDVLHELRNVIINIFMGCIILQNHSLSSRPLTNAEKKKNYRQTRHSACKANNNSQALIPQAKTTNFSQIRGESSQQLQTLQTCHNFQPLTFFLIGGVCGLLVVSRDYCLASLLDCISFTQAILIIKKYYRTPRIQEETIWKNLSAYLFELFQPSFLSPDKIVPFTKPPIRHKLGEAITNDFPNHLRQLQLTSHFFIPHSTRLQITNN